jgi:hypothetical protein
MPRVSRAGHELYIVYRWLQVPGQRLWREARGATPAQERSKSAEPNGSSDKLHRGRGIRALVCAAHNSRWINARLDAGLTLNSGATVYQCDEYPPAVSRLRRRSPRLLMSNTIKSMVLTSSEADASKNNYVRFFLPVAGVVWWFQSFEVPIPC